MIRTGNRVSDRRHKRSGDKNDRFQIPLSKMEHIRQLLRAPGLLRRLIQDDNITKKPGVVTLSFLFSFNALDFDIFKQKAEFYRLIILKANKTKPTFKIGNVYRKTSIA